MPARPGPATSSSADSAQLLAEARASQRRFERLRERHMPRVHPRFRRCDEIIGRFCVWHEPDERWEPPPEEDAVSAARESLLEELEVAARELPGDGWIAGQRVRYLQEAERHVEALEAARACRARTPGWCAALIGYALHGAGDHGGADSAFALALRELPAGDGCRWSDLTLLLDGRGRKAYRSLSCPERAPFEARFWWLSDPLYLVPGNERRAEHFWRHVMDALQERAASGYRTSWGDDLREILVRYGWPAGWEKSRHWPGSFTGDRGTVAHDPPGSRHFAPRGRWLEDPAAVEPGDWELEPQRPRSHYAPAYARAFGRLEPTIARFRRGDTAIVVAAVEATALEMEREGERGSRECADLEAGLFLSTGPDRPMGEARARPEGSDLSLVARLPAAGSGLLVSVEALCPTAERAARARFGLEVPTAEPGISDLLLGRPAAGDSLPATLAGAAAAARGRHPLHPGERVPLYWEVYSARGSRATSVSVELQRQGGGFLRKLARWTGLAGDRQPITGLRWADRRAEPGIWSQAVTLEVPEDAPPGRYELRVTVRLDGGLPLRAERPVEVRKTPE